MTPIRGFDFSQISWKAFSREEMFSRQWYLRRERLILYTLMMLVGMAAQAAATYCMFKYRFLRNHIQNFTLHAAVVHKDDIEAASVLSISLPCIAVLLFHIEYFILLFWPGRTYSKRYLRTKKWAFVGTTLGSMAAVVAATVIVATRSASITGVDEATVQQLTELYFRPPLRYRMWPQNIAWVVLLWIAVSLNIASLALLLKALPREERTTEIIPITAGADGDTIILSEIDSKEKSMVSARIEEV